MGSAPSSPSKDEGGSVEESEKAVGASPPSPCASSRASAATVPAAANTNSPSNLQGRRNRRRLYSFEEARRIARGHGFSSRQEFAEYECPGAYQLPKDPDVVWRDNWRGWDDFLGIPWTYDEGRAIVRARFAGAAAATTKEEYCEVLRVAGSVGGDPDLSRLPHRPDLYYKNDGWTGWGDWLGSGNGDGA
jgi:pyruvate/2-oxoglutarate dehydrogenase complex dihydrolipoamide acyltransferase (E2) component